MQDVSNTADVIDSRDVIARIEELESELEGLNEAAEDAGSTEMDRLQALAERREWLEDNQDELRALKELADEASGYAPDWSYGETLVRDSYFETYAQELADEIGAVPANASWPNNCIDWEQAARDLQMDYTAVDFDGVTYWIR